MFTWTGPNVVAGVVASTGAIVLFLVTFSRNGEAQYTPVARGVCLGAPATA